MKPQIKKNPNLFFCIVIAQVLTACYTYKPIAYNSPQSLESKIEIGEHYRFNLKDHSKFQMKISRVDSAAAFGVFYHKGQKANTFVKYGQIESIEKRKVSVGKTIGISVGCTVFVPILILILFPPNFSFGGGKIV